MTSKVSHLNEAKEQPTSLSSKPPLEASARKLSDDRLICKLQKPILGVNTAKEIGANTAFSRVVSGSCKSGCNGSS